MAFHIERKEYDIAREVVKRALSKINFREENERFNVYMAWFNLEHHFGSEEDADKVFKESVQCNDEFKVYDKVASIYMQSEKVIISLIFEMAIQIQQIHFQICFPFT